MDCNTNNPRCDGTVPNNSKENEMKDYLIYLDNEYKGIKRGPNVDAIIDTYAYTKVEYVSHEDTSKGVVTLYLKTV